MFLKSLLISIKLTPDYNVIMATLDKIKTTQYLVTAL